MCKPMNCERQDRNGFGPLESEVMDVVWRAARPTTVREVVDDLNRCRPNPLAYTTVMTVMSRLAEKGVLTRNKVGRGYVYEAAAPDAAGLAVQDVLRTYGAAAVAHFVNEAQADPAVLRRLRRLLAEADG
jgi:predicted transcriptional regulator